jgi:hypothetical protein
MDIHLKDIDICNVKHNVKDMKQMNIDIQQEFMCNMKRCVE